MPAGDDMVSEYNLDGDFSLDIPNFTKYNKDEVEGPWLRLNTDWNADPRIRKLTPTEQLIYIHLLSLRRRLRKPLENISETYLKGLWNLQGTSVKHSIAKLLKLGLIVLHVRTDETYETNVRATEKIVFGNRIEKNPEDSEEIIDVASGTQKLRLSKKEFEKWKKDFKAGRTTQPPPDPWKADTG